MTRQTYRIIVTKSELYVIDLAAHDEEHAIERAEALWYGRERSRFRAIVGGEPETFAVDHHATDHLAEIANEDRAGWAEKALRCFSRETGSDMGREALHDLICDLGHYADTLKLDFRTELQRAAETWDEEKAEQAPHPVASGDDRSAT